MSLKQGMDKYDKGCQAEPYVKDSGCMAMLD